MASKLALHGSEHGYKTELGKGGPTCTRCQAAHREYNRQFTKTGKAAGLKYASSDVIDHLAGPPTPGAAKGLGGRYLGTPKAAQGSAPADAPGAGPVPGNETGTGEGAPGLAGRLGNALRGLTVPMTSPADYSVLDVESSGYVSQDDTPDYLHSVDPDPEPDGGEWEQAPDSEIIINAAGMKKIEDNLAFYLSALGMTVEIFDPYCGPILANNLDNLVSKWSAIIAHYPGAAKYFLEGKNGIIFAWVAALQATWPILKAIYDHHLGKNVTVQNGTILRKIKNGQQVPQDATTPPMHTGDHFDYTT